MERTDLSFMRAPRRATVAALVVLLVGLLCSFGLWLMVNRLTQGRALDRLVVQAETLAGAIEREAMNVEADLGAVAGLFESSEAVTPEEFETMVDRIQAAAGLAGIAYVPVVTAEELEAFEDQARTEEPGYSVFELNPVGEAIPVAARSTYFPVRYFHPSDIAGPMGLDVASVPDRLPYVIESVNSKKAVSTSLTTIAVFDREGYVVYQPILDLDEEVVGLVVGPVLLETLIREAVPPALAAGVDWSILPEATTVDLASDGLAYVAEAQIGSNVLRLEVRPEAGSSILLEAWRPAAFLGLASAAVAIVAALATFWYLRASQSKLGLENAGELMSAKDRFVATVSHELRTPLAAVLGFAEILKGGTFEGLGTDERREIITTIAEQAGDLADIVEDLLVTARADHGTLATVAVPVDVAAQCRQVIERMSATIAMPIGVSPDAPAVRALGDPGRVRQIIRNLLSNALSYGGPEISISIHTEEATVSIGVRDNGNGVPPSQSEEIFEPYHRVHAASATSGTLGLGLSVSRTLARLMEGDLTYHRDGGITTFELRLPAAAPSELADGTQRGTTPQRNDTEARSRPTGHGSRAQDRHREAVPGASG
ncbi:MAG TPA: ATP-binding protein [Acidimicrobiia bacterium]|nr:ATP-binding protein [Acidimicrobiia bacterium]